MTTHKRTVLTGGLVVLIVVVGIGAWYWFTHSSHRHVRVAVPANITWLDTGLSKGEQAIWHHLTEGSELVPMSVLEALRNPKNGQPFLYQLADYGFLVEDPDPRKLAVGWTTQLREIAGRTIPLIGVNCAACHTGELRYQGHTIRINGAPNLFALEQFFLDLRAGIQALRADPVVTIRFVRDLIRLRKERGSDVDYLAEAPKAKEVLESVNEADGLDQREQAIIGSMMGQSSVGDDLLAKLLGKLVASGDKIERRLKTMEVLSAAIDSGVDLGPGRGDSFGIIRDLLWPHDGVLLDAPVSTPHLFNFAHYSWIHWDGNTQSVMQRNIAQAIALGADYDPETLNSSVLPDNLHRLEIVGRKLRPPAWPEKLLGKIDRVRADRGRQVFEKACADCHTNEKLVPLDVVKTSPARARNFALPLGGRPFPEVLGEAANKAEHAVFAEHAITGEKAREMEIPNPQWRSTGGYIARSLAGVWASPPYLHNGSVPTIYDLLLPADQRPKRFPVGHRDYDPRKLGFTTDVTQPVFTLDTTQAGNSNQGHEYGTDLTDEGRWDLIEYLKTLGPAPAK